MFNKNKNINSKIVNYKYNELIDYNNILVTPSFKLMINNYIYNKNMQEMMDYQDRVTSYINRKCENNIKKQYNPKVVNLYENGIINIQRTDYSLKEFFIVFDNKKNNYQIKCTNPKYNSNVDKYNKAVKLIDTTAFINLINNKDIIIQNNRIIINDKEILNNIIKNWDGLLHSETKETDSILNKKMIEDDTNE